ncbi:MAG: hypothetical protein ACOC9N_03080 [Gemmatimonadota bacterium]
MPDTLLIAFELVVACRRRGIPTVAVQHGQFSRYTTGLMAYGFSAPVGHAFDRYCVWSDFFADILRRHSDLIPSASVVVGGVPGTSASGGSNSTSPDEPTIRTPDRRRDRGRPAIGRRARLGPDRRRTARGRASRRRCGRGFAQHRHLRGDPARHARRALPDRSWPTAAAPSR